MYQTSCFVFSLEFCFDEKEKAKSVHEHLNCKTQKSSREARQMDAMACVCRLY